MNHIELIIDAEYSVWDNDLQDFNHNLVYVGSIFVGETLHLFQSEDGDFYTINDSDIDNYVKE